MLCVCQTKSRLAGSNQTVTWCQAVHESWIVAGVINHGSTRRQGRLATRARCGKGYDNVFRTFIWQIVAAAQGRVIKPQPRELLPSGKVRRRAQPTGVRSVPLLGYSSLPSLLPGNRSASPL